MRLPDQPRKNAAAASIVRIAYPWPADEEA